MNEKEKIRLASIKERESRWYFNNQRAPDAGHMITVGFMEGLKFRDEQAKAQPAPNVRELVEALRSEFPLLDDNGLDEFEHHCEWSIQQDRKRLHAALAKWENDGNS